MESFGCSIAEVQMLGIPVVATRCGGPESIVTPKTGILVDKDNEETLYQGISQMIDNYMKYDSEEIKRYAAGKYSLDTISRQYYAIYRDIVKNYE